MLNHMFGAQVDLVYTAFIVPLNVAFCTTDYGASADSSCSVTDLVGGAHARARRRRLWAHARTPTPWERGRTGS